jgi:isochorismate hydrolase
MDERYITQENIREKAEQWLAQLPITHKRAENFVYTPKKSALLIIDMQDFFMLPVSHAFIPSGPEILPNVNSLIAAYREASLPIIFTYHALEDGEDAGLMGRFWGDVLRTSDPLHRIHSRLDFKDGDTLLRKRKYSAFWRTGLESILEERNIDSLVITGVVTHLCCETTARGAFMRDLEVYFVIDGTAADNEELHLSSLRTLTDGYVMPVTAGQVIAEVERNG